MVEHLSVWHDFDSDNLDTYPEVNARIQVKHANGQLGEAYSLELFSLNRIAAESPVVAWRYIKDKSI
jgi:hypothetical protein